MTADSETLSPPNNPDDFESLCLDLWKDIWGDVGAAKNGRSGQPQGGVDVYGQMNERWMGVQCKQKDGQLHSKVTVAELEREVREALKFKPQLSHFILATSGPADVKVQQRARELTDEHRVKGLFTIEVWSWQKIWHELYGREELLRRVGPIYWPRQWRLMEQAGSGSRPRKPGSVLHGVIPPQPPHYLPRAETLAELQRRLLATETGKVAITAAGGTVGVQGMGGVGKTVLAAAVVRELEIQRAFPDGIFWITAGIKPNLLALLNQLDDWLPNSSGPFTSEAQALPAIRDALTGKRVLLVLDDVWQLDLANALNVVAPPGALLITTRKREVLVGLNAYELSLDVLSLPDALHMLADWAGFAESSSLPLEATEVAKECGCLPLALAMIGAMVQLRPTAWLDALELLRSRDLEEFRRAFPNYPYPNLLRAIAVSVDELPADDRERYLNLAVFPEDQPIPEGPLQVLWNLSPVKTRLAMDRLIAHSLATAHDDGNKTALLLHDLQADYVRAAVGPQLLELHEILLEAYRRRCPDGWPTGPNDGYLFQQLRHHLVETGRRHELRDLVLDLRWLESKNEKGLAFDLLEDFAHAQQHSEFEPMGIFTDSTSGFIALLEESLRREIHFIARHSADYPNALFQSFWNACWWFDSPSSDEFYENEHPELFRIGQDPVLDRLYKLLERWRAEREARGSRGFWLRSLRPPPIALGSAFRAVLPSQGGSINSIAYSPDGTLIAAAAENRMISVWDVATQTLVHQLKPEDRLLGGINDVCFSPDGSVFATIDYIYPGNVPDGGVARLWDAVTGEQRRVMHHGGSLMSIQFSTDGSQLICTTGDGELFAWDCSSGKILWRHDTDQGAIDGLAVSPDGKIVATANWYSVKAWNLSDRSLMWKAEVELGITPFIDCSPDGSILAATCDDGSIKLLDMKTGRETTTLKGHTGRATAVVFSPDGTLLASAAEDDTIRIWIAKENRTRSVLRSDDVQSSGLAFSPDSKQIAVAGGDGAVRIWGLAFGVSNRKLKGHSKWISSLAISPDGKLAATTSDDNTVRVWDVLTGRERFVFRDHTEWTRSATFSPDGKLLASASGDLTVRIREVESGKSFRVLRGHEKWVNSVAFSPDGRWVVSAGHDLVIRLWDVQKGVQLKTFEGHSRSIEYVSFTIDGKRIISEEIDNEMFWHFARVWDVSSGACLFAAQIEDIPFDERQEFKVGLPSNLSLHFREGDLALVNQSETVMARLEARPLMAEIIGLPKPVLVFTTRKNLFIYSVERT